MSRVCACFKCIIHCLWVLPTVQNAPSFYFSDLITASQINAVEYSSRCLVLTLSSTVHISLMNIWTVFKNLSTPETSCSAGVAVCNDTASSIFHRQEAKRCRLKGKYDFQQLEESSFVAASSFALLFWDKIISYTVAKRGQAFLFAGWFAVLKKCCVGFIKVAIYNYFTATSA